MIGGAARAEEGLRKPAVWRYERAEVFFGDEVVEAVYEDGCPRRHCDAGVVLVEALRSGMGTLHVTSDRLKTATVKFMVK